MLLKELQDAWPGAADNMSASPGSRSRPEHYAVQIGAYFYPLTTQCIFRQARAWDVGQKLGIGPLTVPNEFELIRNARSLFEGQGPPPRYCLPDGDQVCTEWDDSETNTLLKQWALAREYGLSYFIFDAYDGIRQGEKWRESSQPTTNVRTIARAVGLLGFKYAKMQVLESPRVVMPIPLAGTKKGFGGSFAEPERRFDLTPETARFIVDCCIDDWRNERDYLYVKGRPYLSLLLPPGQIRMNTINDFVDAIRTHAVRKYGWRYDPYLVGVMRNQAEVKGNSWWPGQPIGDSPDVEPSSFFQSDYSLWKYSGVDAVTQYCDLPSHGQLAKAIQSYPEATESRRKDWAEIQKMVSPLGPPFIPSPAVGWDASSRDELAHLSGHPEYKAKDRHPYTPLIVGNTPEAFQSLLTNVVDFALEYVPADQRQVTIFAWNEISEGAALLPRLQHNGTICYDYLEAVYKVVAQLPLARPHR